MSLPEIFDRNRRRVLRDRAATDFTRHGFVREAMIDGIHERLSSVRRSFGDVLDIGCADGGFTIVGARIARTDPGYRFAATVRGVQAEEDRLPFADASFDLVVAAGTLDSVSDVPGALTLIRRILRPNGLFLGALLGADSLSTLRSVFREAEGDRPVARFHPRIDVRSAGDLLLRAGFVLPVADLETLTVRYSGIARLLADVRGMAASSLLSAEPLSRAASARAIDAFEARAEEDGRISERFDIIGLTGWAPPA